MERDRQNGGPQSSVPVLIKLPRWLYLQPTIMNALQDKKLNPLLAKWTGVTHSLHMCLPVIGTSSFVKYMLVMSQAAQTYCMSIGVYYRSAKEDRTNWSELESTIFDFESLINSEKCRWKLKGKEIDSLKIFIWNSCPGPDKSLSTESAG